MESGANNESECKFQNDIEGASSLLSASTIETGNDLMPIGKLFM